MHHVNVPDVVIEAYFDLQVDGIERKHREHMSTYAQAGAPEHKRTQKDNTQDCCNKSIRYN